MVETCRAHVSFTAGLMGRARRHRHTPGWTGGKGVGVEIFKIWGLAFKTHQL